MSFASVSTTAKRPNFLLKWVFSSIGKKTIVAGTGLLLVGFLVAHLLGNMTIFLGQDALNTYAEKLHSLGPLLWLARIGLLAIFVLHIVFTMLLWKENRAASPAKYAAGNAVPSSVFVKTMRYTGLLVFAFVIFHLAHFTLGWIQPGAYALRDELGRPDVYSMVILGFQVVPISLFYLIALVLLTFHLSHGISSLFQTLGLSNRMLRPRLEAVGTAVAWILCAGYVSIPISVLFGLVQLP
jgi:succinate dehydrogenase / fumarate reductase cytochrome b subunit